MKFGFFKKDDGDGKKKDDLFDPEHDSLDFDELEESDEFLSNESYVQPPSPSYPPAPQPPRPTAPPPAAPPPPSSPLPAAPASPLPPAGTTPPKPAAPMYDDLTVINQPGVVPPAPSQAQPGPPPPAAPPPAAPPVSSAPAVPPPAPSRTPPPRFAPPPMGDDDKTQVLRAPVGVESVVAWLVVADGTHRGRDFRLPGGMARIGIDPASDICLDFDTFVSGRHAEISFNNGQYQIRDLGSTNGSFVNDTRIAEAVLNNGDRLRLGQTTFVFTSLSL